MQRMKEDIRTVLNWSVVIVLLLLPVACAVPQGGSGRGLMGVEQRQHASPDQLPTDRQVNPALERGGK